MKSILLLTGMALAAAAQPAKVAPAPASQASQVAGKAAVPASIPVYRPAAPISRQTFTEMEGSFDHKIEVAGPNELFDLLGDTRGIYLDGYGAVFTVEVSLIKVPGGPFQPRVHPPAQKEDIRKREAAQLPGLRNVMREAVQSWAKTLVSLPPDQKIVLSARLMYQDWQDTTGLPGEIVVSADRKSALAGNIQVDEH